MHFHQLFLELSQKVICPQCKQKISPLSLELRSSNENSCVFEATCDKCGNIANISAIVETQVTEEGQKLNASSRIHNSNVVHFPISEQEIGQLKDQIISRGSFQTLFKG